MEQSYQEQMHRRIYRQRISVSCVFLCITLFAILGVLPIVPDIIVKVLKPIYILICIAFYGGGYYRIGFEKWLIFLLSYLLLILLTNIQGNGSISVYASMLLFAIFYFYAGLRIWNPLEIRTILKTVMLAGFVCAIITFFSNGGSFSVGNSQHIYFLSKIRNRNSAAFSIAPGTVTSILLFFNEKKGVRSRMGYVAVFLVSYLMLIALSCRSAFLSATTGIFLIIWHAITVRVDTARRFFRRSLLLVFVYITLIVLMRVVEGTSSARLFDYSNSGRDDLWKEAIDLIRAKPVFGGGFDYWSRTGHVMSPHNTFFSIMLISGYIGGILLVMMIFSMINECLRQKSIFALAFAMQMFFHSISEAGLDYYAYIPLILTSIVLRYSEYQQSDYASIFFNPHRGRRRNTK